MPIPDALLLRPENRVLLLCARGPQTQSDFGLALGEVLDWDYLVSKLHPHRLTMLFLHHLRGHEARVPPEVLRELQLLGEQILHWNLFLLAELQGVTNLLCEEGVRVLSYKGPAIAYSAYNSLALRRFGDLDFLISPRDLSRVSVLLQSAGFHIALPQTALTPLLQRQKRRIAYELPFVSKNGFVVLDVHWRVTAPFESFPLDFEELWKRRAPVKAIAGIEAPCREDLIVALCFHGLKHIWQELEWISCLLGLLQRAREEPLDWRHIEGAVKSCGCERVLLLGLRLAQDLSDMPGEERDNLFPAHLQRAVNQNPVRMMARRVWKLLLEPGNDKPGSSVAAFLRNSFWQLSFGLGCRRPGRARRKFLLGLTRSTFVSLEESKIALALAKPFLKRDSFSG